MYKTIQMLDEIAREAKKNPELLIITTNEETIDKFIERHGGERCTDQSGNKFILFEGCKIRYCTKQLTDADSKVLSSPNIVDRLFVEQELTLHRESLEFFKRWGSEIK